MVNAHCPSIVRCALASICALIAFESGAQAGPAVVISEIRIDQPGTDNDEYLELKGTPGASLAGLTYLVIGDGSGASGTIEAVIGLTGLTIGPSGYFVIAEPTFTLGTPDLVVSVPTEMNFENDDNVTHLLVEGFSGIAGDDLDTNDDGVLDVQPWIATLDLIAAIKQENPPTTTEWHYGPPTLGPVGLGAPWHVYRTSDCNDWIIGGGDAGSDDTPGAANPSCPPPPVEHYFGIEHIAKGAALLSSGPAGELLVSNIGSSGQDGASVHVGGAPGFYSSLPLDAAMMPPGSFMISHARGTVGGLTDQPAGSIGMQRTVDGVEAICNFSPLGSPTYKVQIFDEGTLVYSGGGFTQGPLMVPQQKDPPILDCVCNWDWLKSSWTWTISIRLDFVVPGSTVVGDAIVFEPETPPAGPYSVEHVDIVAGDMPQMMILGEGLLAHGQVHTVQQSGGTPNNAHIIGGGDLDGDGLPDIVVSNIGSSGNDGVRVSAGGFVTFQDPTIFALRSITVETDWGPAGALPAESSVQWWVDAQGPIIKLAVNETGGGHGEVSVDCAACDSSSALIVQSLLNGVIVDTVVHLSPFEPVIAGGDFGSTFDPAGAGLTGVTFSAATLRACDATGNLSTIVASIENSQATPITLAGSLIGPVTANALRVKVKFPTLPGDDDIFWARLMAANVAQFATLNGASLPEFSNDLTHFGLPHDTLGNAGIAVNEQGIQITNIGSSGQDGVSISLGEAQGLAMGVDIGQAGALGGQAIFYVRKNGSETFEHLELSIAETDGGNAAVAVAQNVCAPCSLQVDLMLNGDVVGNATYPAPYPPELVRGSLGSTGPGHLVLIGHDFDFMLLNPQVVPLELAGQAPVDANAVRVSLNGLPPGEPVGTWSIDMTAQGVPEVVISSERVIQFGNQHGAQGQATVCASRDNHLQGAVDVFHALRVGNIGSSGQDGVEIRAAALIGRDDDGDGYGDLTAISLTLEPTIMPPSSKLAIKTKGTGAQIVHDVELEIEAQAGFDQVSADFTSIGSTTHTVEVYDNGNLVASQTGVGAEVAQVAGGKPSKAEAVFNPMSGADLVPVVMHKVFKWEQVRGPISITLPGQKPVTGDELRVIPENPTVQTGRDQFDDRHGG
ncbi:MAG: hypothetical protein L0219_00160 [Phycisphaerales bacterium]|nr:hypothetical protein [Phycisphaerales bacterium]